MQATHDCPPSATISPNNLPNTGTLSNPHKVIASKSRIKPGRLNSLRQIIKIQQRVYDEAINPTTKPSDVAQLARAWDCLEDRKRILRGRPLPGSLKPDKPKKAAHKASGPSYLGEAPASDTPAS